MLSKKYKAYILTFLTVFTVTLVFAEETRLVKDKLIFSNGGGFENDSDMVRILNVGKGGAYVSKGVAVLGDYISIDTEVLDYSSSAEKKKLQML